MEREYRCNRNLSSNGNIQPVTIQGTYTVNRDGTGTMTL